jgi:CelD/BcsL family acetyltransferase involved in cellulose biosynthesis
MWIFAASAPNGALLVVMVAATGEELAVLALIIAPDPCD